jgi:GH15 family glucan-1,4-alpha-glucosidase
MPKIEDYGIIGDLQTSALVSREGSIDWCCFPRFDSGACFAAILGEPDNGRWLIAPALQPTSVSRRYRHDTLILETLFETEEGTIRVIDFMPPRERAPDIVRIVEGLGGTVTVRSELTIRFDYGNIVPWVRRVGHDRIAVAGPDALCFRTPVELRGEDMRTVAEFTVRDGERVPFVLTWFPSHDELPAKVDAEQALRDTEDFWMQWAAECEHEGPYHEEIHQSLLVLKALTYQPTGGIVAAPTSSLPEWVGSERNWDYRFCWLRDATLTLLAMMNFGYRHEAEQWRDWLLRAVAGAPEDVQIMYGIGGERRLDERELEWLSGYEDSRPVRVGNAASEQLQLDIYGEVIDAMYQTRAHGAPPDEHSWAITRKLLGWLETGWHTKDSGIWEVRGPSRHFTHSKVMAWVAFDRAVRFVEELGGRGPVDKWRRLRDQVRAEVLEKAWSDEKQSFAQSYGSNELDASVLLMPLVGFLPATDERMLKTVKAVEHELTVDGFVQRYVPRDDAAVDGLVGDEGVFLPCSFWLVDVLALQGHQKKAETLFQRLLSLRNDLGLIAEEYDPVGRRMLGNFPQAFTHLALLNSAHVLGEGRTMRRHAHSAGETKAPRAPSLTGET